MVVLKSHGRTIVAGAALAVGLLAADGCADIQNLLNPTFLQAIGVGESAATLPGEAPAVVIEVDNGTQRVIEFRITWRDAAAEVHERTEALGVGEKYAEALICPVEEMTLGDVGNLDATGAIVRLGGGSAADPYVEVEPFGVLLQEGINYDCGDVITFTILPSSATLSGYQSFAFIRRSEAQTQTP
jgi:hypothetical protein